MARFKAFSEERADTQPKEQSAEEQLFGGGAGLEATGKKP